MKRIIKQNSKLITLKQEIDIFDYIKIKNLIHQKHHKEGKTKLQCGDLCDS